MNSNGFSPSIRIQRSHNIEESVIDMALASIGMTNITTIKSFSEHYVNPEVPVVGEEKRNNNIDT
jgi:hypothetical protein